MNIEEKVGWEENPIKTDEVSNKTEDIKKRINMNLNQ